MVDLMTKPIELFFKKNEVLGKGSKIKKYGKYQPSGEGGARLPPAKSKMAAWGPKNGRLGLGRFAPLGFWAF